MELGVYRFYEYIFVSSKTHVWCVYIINYSKLLIERKNYKQSIFNFDFSLTSQKM